MNKPSSDDKSVELTPLENLPLDVAPSTSELEAAYLILLRLSLNPVQLPEDFQRKLTRVFLKLLPKEATAQHIPKGWRPGSTASYYKESAAKDLQVVLDSMIAETPDAVGKLKDRFLNRRVLNLNKATLYQKITQGWLYLIEHMDPEGVYKNLRLECEVQREHEGVRIARKANMQTKSIAATLAASATLDGASQTGSVVNWRSALEEFIVNAKEDDVFNMDGLTLDDEDIQNIKSMLITIPGMNVIALNERRIKLLFNMEMYG
jgi:hypothetical protein